MKPPSEKAGGAYAHAGPETECTSNLIGNSESVNQTDATSPPPAPNLPCDTSGNPEVSQPTRDTSGIPKLSQKARQLARDHKVSLRTAYRHLARGTTPSADKRVGRDGKSYPAYARPRQYHTQLSRELALTVRALDGVRRSGEADGYFPEDLLTLEKIKMQSEVLVKTWRNWV